MKTTILAIESSCDETAVAVVTDGREVLSSVVLSQADEHAVYGGVVPEIASRRHVESITGLCDEALREAGIIKQTLNAIAVTYAPGLIGALLVGVNFAKAAASALGLPIVPVHHLRGHIAANYIAFPELKPPFICLVASGGHSIIVHVKDYTRMETLGGTRDDAAGEAFDKIARVMGLGYPGGAALDKLASGGNDRAYALPHAKIDGYELDMSFSGLKTAVLNILNKAAQKGEKPDLPGLAASFSAVVSETLVSRLEKAARLTGCNIIAAAGGVAANSRVRRDLAEMAARNGLKLYIPPIALCGDNAAMIGAQGYYEFLAGNIADSRLNAYASREI